jgi:hypothetical protein
VQVAAVEGKLGSTILIHVPLGELENSVVPIKRKKIVFIKEERSFPSRVQHCFWPKGLF